MKLIELHILQSFPVSCLNRDDVGSPKTAYFGGVQRARVSSQCQKRATRLEFNSIKYGNSFHTHRTRLAHEELVRKLGSAGMNEDVAFSLSLEVLSRLVDKGGASKAKVDQNGRMNMPALIWLSPGQLDAAASATIENQDLILKCVAAIKDSGKKDKKLDTALSKALKPVAESIRKAGISDAGDIALFGRMVANDPTLNVEGSAMFSHALSTHKSSNEVDYYSAVDDMKAKHGESDSESEDSGAGMIGTLEFTSAVYYRYAALNLDLLFDETHLGKLDTAERKEVVDAFIRATLMAVPGARKNSMNAATLPFEVLAVYKEKGQPIQLVNAFEKPVIANGSGLAETSSAKMKEELATLKRVWDVEHAEELWLSESGLKEMISKLSSHVA